MTTKFLLKHDGTAQSYGVVSFNGKFVFKLDEKIDLGVWNKIGFIPLDESRCLESEDLFMHLNNRLPITLRSKSNEAKIDYIRTNGLRVASDGFFLEEIRENS